MDANKIRGIIILVGLKYYKMAIQNPQEPKDFFPAILKAGKEPLIGNLKFYFLLIPCY